MILLTGGSGRLGTELRRLLPDVVAPSRTELDLTEHRVAFPTGTSLVVHAAAYTDVLKAETERAECWNVNVTGTRNVARACLKAGIRMIHISTDYVFSGQYCGYKEEDVPGPALNHYALSKIVAEEAARAADALVIRTSFRPREWPHPKAYADMFTSQDYVDVIAPQIALAIERVSDIPFDTLHIAGPRRSVLELARLRKPDVLPGKRSEAAVNLPADISLDTSRWQQLLLGWRAS